MIVVILKTAAVMAVLSGLIAAAWYALDPRRRNVCVPVIPAEPLPEASRADAPANDPQVAVLRCKGGTEKARRRFVLAGPRDCRRQYILFRGNKVCPHGCIGGFHCVSVCPNQAIQPGPDGLPVIDIAKCVGCGTCVKGCPRRVIELVTRGHLIYLACDSASGDKTREFCSVGCTGCGVCFAECPHAGAIAMADNRPRLDYHICTSCGICHHKCPNVSFIDRVAKRPYALISLQCDGCGDCKRLCQFGAIHGQMGKRHMVIKEQCVGCGRCFQVCPIRVITMVGALGYTQAA